MEQYLGYMVVLVLAFGWGMYFGTIYERKYGVHTIGGMIEPPRPWPNPPQKKAKEG